MSSLALLLSRLNEQRFSGRICLKQSAKPGRHHTVVMRNGLICAATLAGDFDPLGRILIRRRKLDPAGLLKTLERMTSCEQLQGQLLCQLGLATSTDIESALRDQLGSRMERLLGLDGVQADLGKNSRQRGGPAHPLHPHSAIWRHICQLSPREVHRRWNDLDDRLMQIRPGRRPPLWLFGPDGVELTRALSRPSRPAALPKRWRRHLLFLSDAGLVTNPPERTRGTLPGDDAKQAYHRLALALHPDRHPDATDAERTALMERFARATAAYHEAQQRTGSLSAQKIKAS